MRAARFFLLLRVREFAISCSCVFSVGSWRRPMTRGSSVYQSLESFRTALEFPFLGIGLGRDSILSPLKEDLRFAVCPEAPGSDETFYGAWSAMNTSPLPDPDLPPSHVSRGIDGLFSFLFSSSAYRWNRCSGRLGLSQVPSKAAPSESL